MDEGDNMKYRLAMLLIVISTLLLAACGQKEIKNALNWDVEDFSATTNHNKTFSLKDLEGKTWIADFIFTNCGDVCPPMTANMAKLQKMVKEEEFENVEFVSFSVDPSVDTPEILTAYAQQFNADLKNWTFLTGYSQEFIESFARKTFKTIVKKPEEGNQVIHQTYVYLVGPDGKIKKTYDLYKDVPYETIISDIKKLQ